MEQEEKTFSVGGISNNVPYTEIFNYYQKGFNLYFEHSIIAALHKNRLARKNFLNMAYNHYN